MAIARSNRAPLGRATAHDKKRTTGSTDAAHTPLSVRTSGIKLAPDIRDSARSRMGAKLGKFAERIERVTVRFADENGPRGGVDTTCRVKVVLSGLDSVVFESHAHDAVVALQLAASGIERAVRRTLARASAGKRASSSPRTKSARAARQAPEETRSAKRAPKAGSVAPKKAMPTPPGASYALESSAQGRPSRKSTRKSANRSKPDSNLQRREIRRTRSPTARARRSIAAKGAT